MINLDVQLDLADRCVWSGAGTSHFVIVLFSGFIRFQCLFDAFDRFHLFFAAAEVRFAAADRQVRLDEIR